MGKRTSVMYGSETRRYAALTSAETRGDSLLRRVAAEAEAARPSPAESEERQLMLRLEMLAQIEGLREDGTVNAKIPSTTQALIDSKADDGEVLKRDGSVILEGPFVFKELSADPDDPAEGHAVMWLSDGTGSGSAGDVMIKITAGGATKTTTLVDFSMI